VPGRQARVTRADRLLSRPRITAIICTPKRQHRISATLTHALIRRAPDMNDKLELTIAATDSGIHDSACLRARNALISAEE
jgi:hypothetical protein